MDNSCDNSRLFFDLIDSFDNKRFKRIDPLSTSLSFPQKLFYLLSCQEFLDVISWTKEGTSFQIFHRDRFMRDVVPRFFNRKLD